jgi:hypothetical protein
LKKKFFERSRAQKSCTLDLLICLFRSAGLCVLLAVSMVGQVCQPPTSAPEAERDEPGRETLQRECLGLWQWTRRASQVPCPAWPPAGGKGTTAAGEEAPALRQKRSRARRRWQLAPEPVAAGNSAADKAAEPRAPSEERAVVDSAAEESSRRAP